VLSALTALFWVSSPNMIEDRLIWLLPRKKQASGRYTNKYLYVFAFLTVVLGTRMIFFSTRGRESGAIWAFLALSLFLVFQIAHRLELYQARKTHSLMNELVALVIRHSAPLAVTDAAGRRDLLIRCRDGMRYVKEVVFYLSLVPLIGTFYFGVAQKGWPQLLSPLVQNSPLSIYRNILRHVAPLEIQFRFRYYDRRNYIPDLHPKRRL
jgi:hypothetical protein